MELQRAYTAQGFSRMRKIGSVCEVLSLGAWSLGLRKI